jgi:hypothetical protein
MCFLNSGTYCIQSIKTSLITETRTAKPDLAVGGAGSQYQPSYTPAMTAITCSSYLTVAYITTPYTCMEKHAQNQASGNVTKFCFSWKNSFDSKPNVVHMMAFKSQSSLALQPYKTTLRPNAQARGRIRIT